MCMGGGGGGHTPTQAENQYRIDAMNSGLPDPGYTPLGRMSGAMRRRTSPSEGSLLAPAETSAPQGGSTLLGT